MHKKCFCTSYNSLTVLKNTGGNVQSKIYKIKVHDSGWVRDSRETEGDIIKAVKFYDRKQSPKQVSHTIIDPSKPHVQPERQEPWCFYFCQIHNNYFFTPTVWQFYIKYSCYIYMFRLVLNGTNSH